MTSLLSFPVGWLHAQSVHVIEQVRLTSTVGTVNSKGADGQIQTLVAPVPSGKPQSADKAGQGATISTGEFSSAVISIPSAGSVKLNQNTEVRLPPAGDKSHSLELLKGQLFFDINAEDLKKRGDTSFRLKTPAALLAVKGTKFFAVSDVEGKGVLGVHSGSVGVFHPSTRQVLTLKNGQAVSVDLNQMGGVRTLTKEEAADSLQYAVVDAKTGFTNSLGMKFVPVPGTRVLMCVHEVRMLDWKACVKKVRGLDSKESRGWSDDQPVQLNWDEALAFCEWLSQEDGLGYRVSTDREWSFSVGIGQDEVADALPAMLGGKIKDQYPWGAVWPPPQGAGNYPDQTFIDETKPKDGFTIPAYNDGFALASPVMSFAPNHLGIYDLGGNLWEWTSSWYDGRQDSRSVRGAGFMLLTNQETLLSSCRGSVSLGSKSGRGLRVVIEVPQ